MPRPKKPKDETPRATSPIIDHSDPPVTAQEARDRAEAATLLGESAARMKYEGPYEKFYFKGVTTKKGGSVKTPANWTPGDIRFLLRHGWKKA